MGAGTKTKTLHLKEKSQHPITVNCSAPARNLRKSDIRAVIFGCKNHTIAECYARLPATHFSYVRNITPGLPLFLFNYSDRKLHGIFEATSTGQMNIDRYGWTDVEEEAHGQEYTKYAAQVRVRIQKQCRPLSEDQFGPVIADNYYERKLFWFELDRAQTSKLISLFTSSPVNVNVSWSQTARCNTPFHSVPTHASRQPGYGYGIQTSAPEADFGCSDQTKVQWSSETLMGAEAVVGNPNSDGQSYSFVGNTSRSIFQRKWSALFEHQPASDTASKDKSLMTQRQKPTFPPSSESNMKSESSRFAPSLDGGSSHHLEASGGELVTERCDEAFWHQEPNCTNPSLWTEEADSLPHSTSVESKLPSDLRNEVEFGNSECHKATASESSDLNDSSYFSPHSDTGSQTSESSVAEDAKERYDEVTHEPGHPKPNVMNTDDSHANDTYHPVIQSGFHVESKSSSIVETVMTLKPSDLQSLVVKEHLKMRCDVLESGPLPPIRQTDVEAEPLNEPHPESDELVVILGGYDGSAWLSAFDSYSPSYDITRSLSPMTFLRSYASVAKLDGELYIMGGTHGNVCYYFAVESYNPISDTWVIRPSLNQKRGSLAGASLNGKIYAIGGGNRDGCFSEVEMLDLNIGKWIFTRSMQHERFAPAVAEINNTLYVVGGYDGRNYLKSFERFDPREYLWTGLKSMSTRRGCHSLVVLNEKLYALGGYDGAKMVSTVEVFDPRIGSWTPGGQMNDPKGYFGPVVIGDKIYTIGGVKEGEDILDTIECYKEGCGWEVTNLKAIGKRCFFSAFVL
ncbi:hypothetical protein RJ639_042404 [Escallonia herrerae]|uniref:DCD domain-containing protein n=1 Tax=Escallonia herrerae TaxID=1293975 RepID=A0AA88WT71_9ASTE|nr:hypothetical protein RJ639_042404 [Escallonia herrerae]